MKKTTYKSDVVLGDEYSDSITGLKGIATAATFYLHACERVTIEFIKDGKVEYESFDAPRLVHIPTQKAPAVTRTGGPGGREARQAGPVPR